MIKMDLESGRLIMDKKTHKCLKQHYLGSEIDDRKIKRPKTFI